MHAACHVRVHAPAHVFRLPKAQYTRRRGEARVGRAVTVWLDEWARRAEDVRWGHAAWMRAVGAMSVRRYTNIATDSFESPPGRTRLVSRLQPLASPNDLDLI